MVETIKKIENIYYLQIGVQGENIATAIQFDMSTWITEHPNAHIHVLFKPYNATVPAPVATELDGNILTWRPSYAATSVSGVGYTEVRAIDSDTGLVKKSRIIPTSVENSVSGTDGTVVPSPFLEWVNQVLSIKDDAVRAAEEIADMGDEIENAIAIMQKISLLTTGAHTVAHGAGSSATLSEVDGHYHIEFGSEQGAPGRDGAVQTLGDAEFAFHIDENGHLIMDYGGNTPPPFEIDSRGHLIYNFSGQSGGGGDTPTPSPAAGIFGSAVFGTAVFA